MKGPLRSLRDDDANLARGALGLVKSAQLLPAVLVLPLPEGLPLPDLTVLEADLLARELERASELMPVVSARLPMVASQAGRVHVFRPGDGGVEHYAIEIGQPDRAAPVLTRLHSACFTGDVLGSLKCDCGPQLQAALARMGQEGAGYCYISIRKGAGSVLPTRCAPIHCRIRVLIPLRPITDLGLKMMSAISGWARDCFAKWVFAISGC